MISLKYLRISWISVVVHLHDKAEAGEPVFFIFDAVESYQALVVADEVLIALTLSGPVREDLDNLAAIFIHEVDPGNEVFIPVPVTPVYAFHWPLCVIQVDGLRRLILNSLLLKDR